MRDIYKTSKIDQTGLFMSSQYKFDTKPQNPSWLRRHGLTLVVVGIGVFAVRQFMTVQVPFEENLPKGSIEGEQSLAEEGVPLQGDASPEALKPFLEKGYTAHLLGKKAGVLEYKLQKGDDLKLFYVIEAYPSQGFLGIKTDSSGQIVMPEIEGPAPSDNIAEGNVGVHALTLSSIEMAPPATQAYEDAGKYLAYIPMGNVNLPPIYYFADPDCANCQKAWVALLPFLQAGKVHLRVLPSGARTAPDWYTMTIDEIILSVLPKKMGGIPLEPKGNQLDKAKAYVQDIEAFLDDYNIQGYPTFIFRGPDETPVILQGYSDRLVDALGLGR